MNSRKLFGTVICAIFVLSTSSAVALGQNDPAADSLLTGNGEDSPPSFSETAVDQSQCAGCCDAGLRSVVLLSAMDGLGRFHHPGPDRQRQSNAR